ncbi:mannose-1-phosphate guanylyltransferase [Paenibacillus hodogayensis]|uniref:Mannose-1-phosphate guanylyltransferase n=1 Tax=Paenibacillus hodogayensis TaxID=279208 RepID=A0ABV5VSY6_9BACL
MKIVILAGGSGTRFWPRSVKQRPKQFLALTSDETMLQQTYRRFLQVLPADKLFVITANRYRSLVQRQLPELAASRLLLEPEQRDTGPCIALTAFHFLSRDDDEVLVTMPSDHFMEEPEQLIEALRQAEQAAVSHRTIVTLGIVPTRPETGYGYMRTAVRKTDEAMLEVTAFVEKPPLAQAEELVRDPGVFWNSGIFVWKPSTIAHYMRQHQPYMWNLLSGGEDAASVYALLPKISVDYAILEKADSILTLPVRFRWDDVGIWTSLERIQTTDADGNIVGGRGKTFVDSTTDSIIYSDHPKTMIIGVRDLIVVSTAEGLLVCRKSDEQRIKTMLKTIEQDEGGA